jgi:hypothetical protein
MTGPAHSKLVDEAHFKDAVLERLANTANVAQFVSFGPGADPPLRFMRLRDDDTSHTSHSLKGAIRALLERCVEHSVNVRSFEPYQPKAHEFIYGLAQLDDVTAAVRRLAATGLHTIVNETIDVTDGGVSGVSYAGVLEFAPGDTPRCVEKPGTALFPRDVGLKVLETVYGFRPTLEYDEDLRVEFSVHPLKRGFRHEHTIIWEMERATATLLPAELIWPNLFSRLLGDKAFGLLVADALNLPVPSTTVIGRKLAPFSFGRHTGSAENWIRTCPAEQEPGRFPTRRGWLDPFRLMIAEDAEGQRIASVLSQEGVEAAYSGASVVGANGEIIVEGVAGTGEDFMQGRMPPARLPPQIISDVRSMQMYVTKQLGAGRLEWAHDGGTAWVLQLHRGVTSTSGRVIYPGEAKSEHRFAVQEGLEALRALVETIKGTGQGIVLLGNVGVTSHLGDVLRRARIPSRIESSGR